MIPRSFAPALASAVAVAALAGCAPNTLPPAEGSAASATPTTGGPPGGTPHQASHRSDDQTADESARTYECNDGRAIRASYPDTDHAVVAYQDQQRRMHIAVSADGARYVGNDYEWWTRGADATLFTHADDGSTGDKVTACHEQ